MINVCYDGVQIACERGERSAALKEKQWNELGDKLRKAVELVEQRRKE